MIRPTRGFVLPLTIWILVAVAVMASFLAERVQKSLQLAQSRQELNEVQIALSNARAEILFRLATQPMGQCGSGLGADCIALDDRRYGFGATVLQLQDARGLFNLTSFSDEQLDRLLASFALAPGVRARLIDTLRDYTDADNLRRLNGAEASDYAAQSLPAPRNAPLLTPLELRAVLGWSEASALWGVPSITDLATVGSTVAINPNTAPAQVLRVLPGVTPELATAVIARRRDGPVDVDLLDRMVGGGLSQMPPLAIAFPAGAIRVTQRAGGLPWGLRYNVRLTPKDAAAPWQISDFHRLELPADPPSAVAPPDPASLPARSAAAASQAFQAAF